MMSNTIGALAKALAEAQAELKPAIKSAENPAWKSTYADLTACLEAALPVLSKHKLAICQTTNVTQEGNRAILNTVLMHESGEWIMGSYPIICRDYNNPQNVGAGVTYSKRYALAAMIGLGTEDDDGQEATTGKKHDALEKTTETKIPGTGLPKPGTKEAEAPFLEKDRVDKVWSVAARFGWTEDDVYKELKKFGKKEVEELTYGQFDKILQLFETYPKNLTHKPKGGPYSERTKIGV